MENSKNRPLGDIRIGMNTLSRNVIRYANGVLKEHNLKTLVLSAVGDSIGKLVSIAEILKIVNPGFYQINKISTVSHQTVDSHKNVINQRLHPKLEVTLTFEEPKEKQEGYQPALNEEERLKLFEIHNNRGRFDGQQRKRTDSFGRGRGFGRGERGIGFRGRGFNRGGFRGRGFNRGGFRERTFSGGENRGRGFGRGENRGRGFGREENRGRGFDRGGFRGRGFGRGGYRERGFDRGGLRGRGFGRGGYRGRGSDRENSY